MRTQVIRSGVRKRSRLGAPGVALVIALLLVGLMLVMGLTLINLASSDFETARNESLSIQAGHNADAGLEEVKMRLNPSAPATITWQNGTPVNNVQISFPTPAVAHWRAYILSGWTQTDVPTLDPCFGKAMNGSGGCGSTTESTSSYQYYQTIQDPNPSGCGSNCGQVKWGWARVQFKVDNSGNVMYRSLADGSMGTSATWAACSLTNLPVMIVTSEGLQRLPGITTQYVRRQVQAVLSPQYTAVTPCSTTTTTTTTTTTLTTDPFAMAAHASNTITLVGNSTTDSYDSRLGTYGGTNVGRLGSVSTDATTSAVISTTSNTVINGQALAGPGANTSTALSIGGTINPPAGDSQTGTEAAVMNMPLPQIPSGVKNSGALRLSGNTNQTYPGGTYWFSSLSITGLASLNFSGPAVVYVTGSINVGGNGTGTANNLPPNLLIYGTQDPGNPANVCTSVNLHGNGSFYGAVYAPRAAISVVGNAANYGSLTGNTVSIDGNGGFHYDQALGNLGQMTSTSTTNTTTTSFTPASGGSLTAYQQYSWREVPF